MSNVIKIQTTINAPVEKVWQMFNEPEHIKQWNHANDDWHSPKAESDFVVNGKFVYRMEAKDGSFGFDFEGVFYEIIPNEKVSYTIADGRKVNVYFTEENGSTIVDEDFEAESQNPEELQQQGWQAILDNFKRYVENN